MHIYGLLDITNSYLDKRGSDQENHSVIRMVWGVINRLILFCRS
ncbi:Uncharacterised protein [Legionella gratiana]|uniref:Uncharacterized protein n=1 Tax=Legionella gratiana TaxID=45066 RepID=A0A378JDG9_9GAMM|nr:Uncharacterised protein [Legionella gratiana]